MNNEEISIQLCSLRTNELVCGYLKNLDLNAVSLIKRMCSHYRIQLRPDYGFKFLSRECMILLSCETTLMLNKDIDRGNEYLN